MKRYAAALSGVLLMTGCAAEREGEQANPDNLEIVGGTEAVEGSHPWLVSLRSDGFSQCGGTLISPRWVLTAAHCLRGRDALPEEGVTLVFGEHDTTHSTRTEQRRAIKQVIPHPDYLAQWLPTDEPSGHDLALIELRSPVRLTDTVQTLPLSSPFAGELPGTLMIAGWGAIGVTPTDDIYTESLQQTTVALLPSSACAEHTIQPNEFCAGTAFEFGPPRDSCRGDSGGPVIGAETSAAPELLGVVSRGAENCDGIGVYTRLDAYTPWIRSVTGI